MLLKSLHIILPVWGFYLRILELDKKKLQQIERLPERIEERQGREAGCSGKRPMQNPSNRLNSPFSGLFPEREGRAPLSKGKALGTRLRQHTTFRVKIRLS